MKTSLILVGASLVGCAVSAAAADLDAPMLAPEPMSSVVPRWEGMHIGVNGGGFLSPRTTTSVGWFPPGFDTTGIPNSFSSSLNGVMGGAQMGFSKQWGGFVLGAEADFDFAGSKTTKQVVGNVPSGLAYNFTQQKSLDALSTVRGTIGYAPIDDLLIYATAGLAFGQANMKSSIVFANGLQFSGNSVNDPVGFAVGGGVDYAFDPQWSIGLQALYYDLGRSTVVATPNVIAGSQYISPENDSSSEFKGYALRLTLNYDFGGDPAPGAAVSAPESPGDITVSLGVRAGMSTGSSKMNLYGDGTDGKVSRLTYHDANATTGEIYGQISDNGGLFAKGFAGGGKIAGGHLQDEDFAPLTTPYSSTNSDQKDGQLAYVTADLGYYPFQTDWWKFGGLVGYNYLHQGVNAFGCTQTAGNPDICAPGAVAAGTLGISDSYNWNSMRLGLIGGLTLPAGFSVQAEAVWLPFTLVSGNDTHWLRIPQDFSGPITQTGLAHVSYQLEGEVDYALTKNMTIGVGARYWSMNAKGNTYFGGCTCSKQGSQPANFETDRFQGFVQTAYHF